MRQEVAEEEAKCFARWDWEEKLPSPHELVPLSQALIAPDLALAFDIPSSSSTAAAAAAAAAAASSSSSALPVDRGLVALHDASDLDASGGGGEEDPVPPRTVKRPRLVWTPQLHKRFVDAVANLGIANAVPKTIMHIMGVEGLTRENVASHLQKYRLYLKRVQMQGLAAASSPCPAPHPFLGRAAPADPFLPYMPVTMLQQQQQHHHHNHKSADPTQQQQHYYHQILNRQGQGQPVARPSAAMGPGMMFMPAPTAKPAQSAPLVKGEDDGADDGARKRELTLFPSG